ncbi:MAG: hypothetical protein R3D98_06215 [Candidatus Krumholzibacteriia bacterium]
MTTLRTFTLFTLLLAATGAFALDQEGGVRFLVGDPVGDFGDNVDDNGYGLALHYGVRPQRSVTLGVGLHGMTYGSESTTYRLPLVDEFDLTTTNNLAGGFLFAQWRPLDGFVQPYAEGRVGINYLWTESKLEDDGWWNDDEVARKTNQDDFATFWTAGGGLLIRLSEGNRAEKRPGVFLDLKATYQHGGNAEYLTEGAITLVDDEPVFATSESTTELTTYELGVVLTF